MREGGAAKEKREYKRGKEKEEKAGGEVEREGRQRCRIVIEPRAVCACGAVMLPKAKVQ